MRARFRFTKLGKIRWTSHRDVARMWERALRRAQVPVLYSEGFSPRPRLSFGLALPTGAESLAEFLDVDLDVDPGVPLPGLDRLSACLPDGLQATGAVALGPGEPSLQQDVTVCRWEMQVPLAPGGAEAVERFMASESVVVARQRKGKDVTDDVRPAVISLGWVPGTPAVLAAELATISRGLRPSELLAALGWDPAEARLLRTHQWIERDGARREPVPAGATDAPPAERRAS